MAAGARAHNGAGSVVVVGDDTPPHSPAHPRHGCRPSAPTSEMECRAPAEAAGSPTNRPRQQGRATAPEPLADGAATPLASPEVCGICLETIHLAARGGQEPVVHPACSRHSLHLQCLAQLRAQADGPRDVRCPVCAAVGWTPDNDAWLQARCAAAGVAHPQRLSGESTVRAAVVDYALRTFTRQDAPEPRPPPGVELLCCHHVAPVPDRSGLLQFVDLPTRAMRWAPIPIRHDAGIAAWQPSWICPRCAESFELADLEVPSGVGDECRECNRTVRWVFDRRTHSGRTECSRGCSGGERQLTMAAPSAPAPALPTSPIPGAAAAVPAAPAEAAQAAAADAAAVGMQRALAPPHVDVDPRAAGAPRTAVPAAFWFACGPPAGGVSDATNSWLYVPLLHAAATDLALPTLEAWRADPRARGWWDEARQLLMASEPVAPQDLAATLRRAAEAAPAHAHHFPDLLARLERACLPGGARVHVGWAVRQLRESDGYLLAPVQEALLECFGGLQLASALDRHSERFRSGTGGQLPPVALEPAAPDTGPNARGPQPRRAAELASPAGGDGPASSTNEAAVEQERADQAANSGIAGDEHGMLQEANSDIDAAGPGSGEAPAPSNTRVGRASWEWLDSVILHEEFAIPFQPLRDVPRFQAPGVRRAFTFALRALLRPAPQAGITSERAWKLFLLVPRLLLARPDQSGATGKAVLLQRITDFEAGRWPSLLRAARHANTQPPHTTAAQPERTRERACAQVRRGQLSRARQTLTSAPLAPGNAETLRQLTDPSRRPPEPRQPLPQDLASFRPAEQVRLTPAALGEALRTAKRGTAAGLSGAAIEHYRLLLEDGDARHASAGGHAACKC